MRSKVVNHSRVNREHKWGDVYDHLMRKRIFSFIMNKIITYDIQILCEKRLWTQFGFANHLAIIARFISHEKWSKAKSVHLRPAYLIPESQCEKIMGSMDLKCSAWAEQL